MKAYILGVLIALSSCADISPQTRWQHANQLAGTKSWEKLRIPTDRFVMSAYMPKSVAKTDTLTVYIEGDGLAWLNNLMASDDPTPRNPVGLELALRHPLGAAAYLARPCQYVASTDSGECREAYWTNQRFAPEVIEASSQAIDVLKQRAGANKLVLVGYSGGGAVAALVAARRNDVIKLITVAGNLDHASWTAQHHVSPLAGSLNPADEWQALVNLPQWHFVGASDENITRSVADAYASRFPADHRPKVILIPGFDHHCCWAEQWPEIFNQVAH